MTLDYFAAMTLRGIQNDGFADYLPTACFPTLRVVKVFEGYPETIVPPQVVHDWAAERANGKPYLVAFKLDASHFQVDSIEDGQMSSAVFEVPANRR